MQNLKYLVMLTFVLFLMACPGSEESPKEEEAIVYTGKAQPRWVNATAGLRIRNQASLDGEVIGAIPYAEKVMLLYEEEQIETIDNTKGKWSKIRWQEKEGWVFGGFLQKEEITITETEEPKMKLSGRYDLIDDPYHTQYIDFKNDTTCIYILNFCQGFGAETGTYKIEEDHVLIHGIELKCKILSPYELEIIENAEVFSCYNLENGTRLVKNK
ncbi:MAG: SH3 domain-containing protein [Spirochaetales bacterium]|nr:SH3 domain-containing protein [Spirochaetales bacterium]